MKGLDLVIVEGVAVLFWFMLVHLDMMRTQAKNETHLDVCGPDIRLHPLPNCRFLCVDVSASNPVELYEQFPTTHLKCSPDPAEEP